MILCGRMRSGSVAEWLKAHDSKSCGQQCLGGSNPLASATELKMTHFGLFFMEILEVFMGFIFRSVFNIIHYPCQ